MADDPNKVENPPIRNTVEKWTQRIKNAKKRWEKDFQRMRDNMDFLAGYQWEGQDQIRFHKYVCNMTMQMVNNKIASLYAKNPAVDAKRRDRMVYQVWDENPQSVQDAILRVRQSFMMGVPDAEAEAIIQDYQQGRLWNEGVDKVARALLLAFQYQLDSQTPEFKEQMKQLVTTVIVCGVGYVRMNFVRETPDSPSPTPGGTESERFRTAQNIARRIAEGELEEDSAEVEQLRQLLNSIGVQQGEQLNEYIKFDFPDPTSIIPDPNIKCLNEFIGARWMVQEHVLLLNDVNAFFGVDIKPGGEVMTYAADGSELPKPGVDDKAADDERYVCLWEVFNFLDRTRFFVVEGHKEYVQEPAPLDPKMRRFWPLFAITFNRVVVDNSKSLKATAFPPSDVDLVFSSQKEWNRARHALRAQRRANAPKYLARKGLLTENDKAALDSAEANQVVELEGIPNDMEPSKFILPMNHAPIDQMAFDTSMIREDFMLASRMQEANMGPAPSDVTATVGTIAEQSRQSVASSNVDDLDSLLSRIAEGGGELLLRGMSAQTIKRIVGPGAPWPEINREDYLNEVYLQVTAASSGRPNKALEVAQFERMAPILMQAGVNPIFMVKEGVKRMDDRLDVAEAFPLMPMAMGPGGPQQQGPPGQEQSQAGPDQPLQDMPSESPVPLAGA